MIARILLVIAIVAASNACAAEYEPRDGDIIFHTSRSSQSLAIQKATHSPFSHMGIVYVKNGEPLVYEAVEPVKLTPLARWIARGEGGRFVVKRLANADQLLTSDALIEMFNIGKTFEGKHYDLYFEWSDDRMYCSELVWKVFNRSLGIAVGELQTLSEFDLSDPLVAAKVNERWGGLPPGDEIVISPAAIFDSDKLVTVYAN